MPIGNPWSAPVSPWCGVESLEARTLLCAVCHDEPDPQNLLNSVTPASTPAQQAVVPGFTETLVSGGISNPTAMAFAPDGRLFVLQQSGQVRVIQNGVLLATPFTTLSVNSSGERGLLGIAFDPDFSTNRFVYLYYTTSTSPIHNRISRFTANGNVAVAGSEFVLMDLDNLTSATNHNGGAMHFGADRKLYVAVGDNANGANSQTLANRHGKMLRINTDGSVPTDNPFYTQATGANRSIFALGLRNPFTFNVDPLTGRTFVNDVGQNTWEEINELIPGANYGWSLSEGVVDPDPVVSVGVYRDPIHAYLNDASTCAITGGTFYSPQAQQFPSEYFGDYFFADYCAGWIRRLDYNGSTFTPVAGNFASGLSSVVDLQVGPDGSLYYLARGNGGQVVRISYPAGQQAPTIAQHPASQSAQVGDSVTFTVAADGTPTLSYQWQRNGANIPGATSSTFTLGSVLASDDGTQFRVVVTNAFGSVTSNPATLTVNDNQAPDPSITITSGLRNGKFDAGSPISFVGSAIDPEDGPLGPASFSWRVDYLTTLDGGDADGDGLPGITRPFIADFSGVVSGVFTPADRGPYTLSDVAYVITLAATDSQGATAVERFIVYPNTSTLTLATDPTGLGLTLDGQPYATPVTVESVVGFIRPIGAAATQQFAGGSFSFVSWSDGGAATHEIATPQVDTTYTASYAPAPIVVDNPAAALQGSWTVSSSQTGYIGTNYLHDGNTGRSVQKTATYSPTLLVNGAYEVFGRWTANPNRASNARITVQHRDGASQLTVNQRINGSRWVSLGIFNFTAGSASIVVSNAGANGFVIADAFQLVRVGNEAPVTLDNDSPGVTVTGAWTPSSNSPGYIGSNYLHDGNTGKGTKSVQYAVALTGTYRVYIRWAAASNRATNVPVTLTHASGSTVFTINQRINGGTWFLLGEFSFTGDAMLTISNAGTNGYVIADGVQFVRV